MTKLFVAFSYLVAALGGALFLRPAVDFIERGDDVQALRFAIPTLATAAATVALANKARVLPGLITSALLFTAAALFEWNGFLAVDLDMGKFEPRHSSAVWVYGGAAALAFMAVAFIGLRSWFAGRRSTG